MGSNEEDQRTLTRRQALGGGAVVAGGVAAAGLAGCGGGDTGAAYPRRRIAHLDQLTSGQPVAFEYPLKGQSGLLLDLGFEVPGGAGPHGSLVAYNTACQHMGCPVSFRAQDQHFVCPCHQTVYNPAQEGVVVQGVAQRPLPRIALDVSDRQVYATGVDGLIFGWRDNLGKARRAA